MSPVHTKPWPEIVRSLEGTGSPYLPLVRFISNSDYSSELFGGLFLSGLLISDEPVFQFGVHMLRIEAAGTGFTFTYCRGVRSGFANDSIKTVPTEEAVATLDLFLKIKYGVNLRLRKTVD